ncbi:restriction endonuclease subunit S [Nostoc sphaeroides]|uniref:HsdS, type I restriction enzyme, S subunit n=1 Tax=Nostoc sphaeroides CCNUC1 TaxID=2653204 RepID=A0A5P8VZM1_9NOSO|nr:restriction endonuclease subunit S [Nostoc sphaeroides]QFS45885.1 hsdS, type I restriction enzyme, S subunit [Nostoc sphaeroides CCNUC1]
MSDELTELPEGWGWISLEVVADAIDPQPSHRRPPECLQGVPYIGIGDINDDETINFNRTRKVSLDVLKEHQERYILKKGDFIFGKIGTLGKPFKLPEPFDYTLSANVILLQSKRKLLTEDWLFYFMKSPFIEAHILKDSSATSQAAFGIKKIRLTPIAIAPINEQKRIVAKIEELNDRTQRAKEALETIPQLCDRFRQSVLAAAFRGDLTADWREQNPDVEWKELTLGDVIKNKPRNGYSPKPVDYPTKVKSLTLTATTSGSFKPEHFKYIDEDIEPTSHLWLTPGDILIQRSNTLDYVGTSAIYNGNLREFIYPDLMMKIQVIEEKVKIELIHYLLSSQATKEYFKKNATGTAGNMPKINQQVVMNTPVFIPCIEEQKQIVSLIQQCFTAIDCIQQQHQKAEEQLNQLNQSILAKAFRGELVPQDPDDEPASVLLERIRAEREKINNGKQKSQRTSKRKSKTVEEQEV